MAAQTFEEYRQLLSEGADYSSINDVDKVDDYYDNLFKSAFDATPGLSALDIGGGEFGVGGGGAPAAMRPLSFREYSSYVSEVPSYLSDFNVPATENTIIDAYSKIKDLNTTEDFTAALSEYYGYDITPSSQQLDVDTFGGVLKEHTGSSKDQLEQFHSLVEPILKDQIPYLQATQGLSYEDALTEAYKRDPMLQSIFYKFDVDPIRQTEDGSTYLYDPFSFSEIRTFEAKDPTALDIGKDIIAEFAKRLFCHQLLGQ